MTEKVIQFGEGVFLRAFADRFIDGMNKKGLFDGSVVIVQPRAGGRVKALRSQGCSYALYIRGLKDGVQVCQRQDIDSISRVTDPYTEFDDYLALADIPSMRFIISNTTEAGIAFDPGCRFDERPAASFPGKLTQLLYRRFKDGLPGFIILPCELIDGNGAALKSIVLSYSALWGLGSAFNEWLSSENTFADTLVDCIVTGYPAAEADALAPGDAFLDTAEPYHLWVIDGNFEDEFPLQKAGYNVIWTNDVRPYAKRKVRILNGAHTSMVPGAILAGFETVGQCTQDPVVSAFMKKCLFDEIIPSLGGGEDERAFARDVLERFANPYIKHRLRAIALNSVSKFRVRCLPSMTDHRTKYGNWPQALTMSLALLISFYRLDEPNDDPAAVAAIREKDTAAILSDTSLWGVDLSKLNDAVDKDLQLIRSAGAAKAMSSVL